MATNVLLKESALAPIEAVSFFEAIFLRLKKDIAESGKQLLKIAIKMSDNDT
jgi:hypothetical protein